jgi:hypothetical protein
MKRALLNTTILILITYVALKPPNIQNLVATAAAAEPKPPEHATKALTGDPHDRNQANRSLMALSEEGRRRAFQQILALAREQCAEVTRTFYQGLAEPRLNAVWEVECSGGWSYIIQLEFEEQGLGNLN